MRAMMLVAVMLAAGPAMGQSVKSDETPGKNLAATSATMVRNSTVATACGLRDEGWRATLGVVLTVGVLQYADKTPRDFTDNGNKQAARAYVTATMIQAARDGRAEHERYGDAACDALQKSGLLAVLDMFQKDAAR